MVDDLAGNTAEEKLLAAWKPLTANYNSMYERYVFNLKEKVLEPFIENENFRQAIKDYGKEAFRTSDKKIRNDITFLMNILCDKSNYTEQGTNEISIYVIDNDLAKKFSKI